MTIIVSNCDHHNDDHYHDYDHDDHVKKAANSPQPGACSCGQMTQYTRHFHLLLNTALWRTLGVDNNDGSGQSSRHLLPLPILSLLLLLYLNLAELFLISPYLALCLNW